MSTPTLPLYANSELVAVAFIKAVLGWNGDVGTDLPDVKSWTDGFFVKVNVLGGSPDIYTPQEHPVLEVKCYARPATSGRRSPWPAASNLASAIRTGCFAVKSKPLTLRLPGGYPSAFVHSAYPLVTPRRLPNDDSSFAAYWFDLQLHWKQVD